MTQQAKITEAQIEQARALGRQAFEGGEIDAPAQDPELMKLLDGLPVGKGTGLLVAWNDAFTTALLAAPIA